MERRPFFEHLGLAWGAAGDVLTVDVPVRPDLLGPAGSVQGGVVATLVDVAGASSCARALDGRLVATSDLTVHFLAPGRVGPLRALARPLRAGETSAVAEVRVVDLGLGDRLVAVALVSVGVLPGQSAAQLTPEEGNFHARGAPTSGGTA